MSWLGHMMLPEVFPCPKFIMACTQNYDVNGKAIIRKDSEEVVLHITAEGLGKLLGFTAEDFGLIPNDLEILVSQYEGIS